MGRSSPSRCKWNLRLKLMSASYSWADQKKKLGNWWLRAKGFDRCEVKTRCEFTFDPPDTVNSLHMRWLWSHLSYMYQLHSVGHLVTNFHWSEKHSFHSLLSIKMNWEKPHPGVVMYYWRMSLLVWGSSDVISWLFTALGRLAKPVNLKRVSSGIRKWSSDRFGYFPGRVLQLGSHGRGIALQTWVVLAVYK